MPAYRPQRFQYTKGRPPPETDVRLADYLGREFGNIDKALRGHIDDAYVHLGQRWNDLKFPMTQLKLGATSKPDFDYTNCGLLFPQNDATEKAYATDQMPHDWVDGTPLKPHVHFIQTSASMPTFKLDFRVYSNGGTVPSFTTYTSTGTGVFTYSSGSIVQIVPFPEIDMTGMAGKISAIFDVIFYRNDNVVTGDVLVKSLDFHYLLDALGSREVYAK